MSHERLQRIEELADALDIDVDRPEDLYEQLAWLGKHRTWLHGIQELVLSEIEDNYHQQQVLRGEIHGA